MNPWFYTIKHPPVSGDYLVVQDNGVNRYRWVRYFDSRDGWCDLKQEKYGPVTHWTALPDLPPREMQPEKPLTLGELVSDAELWFKLVTGRL